MGRVTRELIQKLFSGGEPARESLSRVSELLRKISSTGFTPCFSELVDEELTDGEGTELVNALKEYHDNETLDHPRRYALRTLASYTNADMRAQLTKELHLVLCDHRHVSADLYELLLGLEDSGEQIYESDNGSRSIADVQTNVEAATEYLNGHGIAIPFGRPDYP